MKTLTLPLNKKKVINLRAGNMLLLSGKIITARDQAHKRLTEAINTGKKLPINPKGQVIYYTGPTPARPEEIIGSCGPTTSRRMDKFTPVLIKRGVTGMIGKGNRSKEVINAIKKYKAIYFITIGGAGAYLSKKIKSAKLIAYPNLGTEAIYELEIKDFPVIVGIDAHGRSI